MENNILSRMIIIAIPQHTTGVVWVLACFVDLGFTPTPKKINSTRSCMTFTWVQKKTYTPFKIGAVFLELNPFYISCLHSRTMEVKSSTAGPSFRVLLLNVFCQLWQPWIPTGIRTGWFKQISICKTAICHLIQTKWMKPLGRLLVRMVVTTLNTNQDLCLVSSAWPCREELVSLGGDWAEFSSFKMSRSTHCLTDVCNSCRICRA